MEKEVIELQDFSLTARDFQRLKSELKAGKAVRNPFARFYKDGVSVTITKTNATQTESPTNQK